MKYAGQLQSIYARMDQEYQNRRQTQQRLASAIASLSPASPLTFAFTTLFGTGVVDAQRFHERLRDFRRQVNQQLFARGYRDFVPGRGGQLLIHTVNLRDVPHFTYERPRMAEQLQSVWTSIVLLVGFNLAFFVAAYLRFRRYDVR